MVLFPDPLSPMSPMISPLCRRKRTDRKTAGFAG
jgi:hypothetical protein